jgi:hypothetical protein
LRTLDYTPTTTNVQFRYVGDIAAPSGYNATNGIWYNISATGESGAQKFLTTILDTTEQVENIRLQKKTHLKHPFDDWGLDSNSNQDWKQFKFLVCDITEEWNQDIDRRIEREIQNSKKKVESLQKQRLL